MRVLFAVALFSLGCSSSATNNSTDETGGTGGSDAATAGGTGGNDSGSTGGSAGSIQDGGLPEGGAAGAAGAGGRRPCMTTQLVINEIGTHGGSDDDEYVELYNLSGKPVSLQPFAIDYADAEGNTDPLWNGNFTDEIPGHGFFVIAGQGFSGIFAVKFAVGVTLEEAGGLRLRGATGPVDGVTWGNVASGHPYTEGNPAIAPGVSGAIGRLPDGHDCENNTSDFDQLNRSPGEPNSF